jgi:hypothetical protein
MPTLLRTEGYRFYFYSHEPNEPPHVHVDKAGHSAKVWLTPVSLARNVGYRAREIGGILAMVREHRASFVEAWNGYFGDSGR